MKKNIIFLSVVLIFSFNIKSNSEEAINVVAGAKNIKVLVEISVGDLFDKISILEIKQERIKDEEKLRNIEKELNSLLDTCNEINLKYEETDKIVDLYMELKKINENLWEIEDKIRELEFKKDFGEEFVSLAREVYYKNDSRCKIKKEINILLNSNLVEEKAYTCY